jgi:S-adenosylmethionine decarboxylase
LLDLEQHRGALRAEHDPIERMTLHTLDAWVHDPRVLTDAERLREILFEGAEAGGATVVGDVFAVFPNRAVTGVLLLAQSHLSIHTWPEFALANVDLLSYGRVRGEDVLRVICEALDVRRADVGCVPRAIG